MYIPHQPCLKAVLVFRGETFCTFKRKQLQRGFPTFLVQLHCSPRHHIMTLHTSQSAMSTEHAIQFENQYRDEKPLHWLLLGDMFIVHGKLFVVLYEGAPAVSLLVSYCAWNQFFQFSALDLKTQCSHRTDVFCLQKFQLKSKNAKNLIRIPSKQNVDLVLKPITFRTEPSIFATHTVSELTKHLQLVS